MKKYIILVFLLLTSISAYATNMGVFLSKAQQNRLNTIVKQLKVPAGDYKLTVTNTGVILREFEPTIVTSTGETIIQEKIIEKIVIVEKPVIIEKIVEKPMSECVDLSNVKTYPNGGRVSNEEMKIIMEIEKMRLRNEMFGCP